MPNQHKKKSAGLSDEVLKELIEEYGGSTAIFEEGGLMGVLQKRLVKTAMGAEMETHQGYSKHSPEGIGTGNSRNGIGKKTVLLANNKIEIETPRDRNGSF